MRCGEREGVRGVGDRENLAGKGEKGRKKEWRIKIGIFVCGFLSI